jgi:SAM-dependent methyltransferase
MTAIPFESQIARVREEYGPLSIQKNPIFGDAGFINFGYWPSLSEGEISMQDRNEASKALYRLVWDAAGISTASPLAVVEVGCGTGAGLSLLFEERAPVGTVTGVDATKEQV